VKINTDIEVTFNLKDKVREINTVKESAASQAYKLYYIDFFMRCNGSNKKFHVMFVACIIQGLRQAKIRIFRVHTYVLLDVSILRCFIEKTSGQFGCLKKNENMMEK
jgi:hypothetical protein